MAPDPQALLIGLIGTTGLGQQIADNATNQYQRETLGTQAIQQGAYQQRQQANEAQAAQQFNRDVLDYNQDPTPQKLSALAMRYPQQAQNFTAAAKLKDDAQRNADHRLEVEVRDTLLAAIPEGDEIVLDGGCDFIFAFDEAALWLEIDLSRVQLAPSELDS